MFVGAGTVLAQDNVGFYFDPATNTLKTRNETNSDSASFAIGTGDVGGSSTGGSGALTIETGDGSPNTSGTDAAGNSGAVTVSTGPGGNSDNGSLAGSSGNLNLKTGSGGGNAFSGFSGGSAGNIILQPGSGGSGPAGQGVGGSTFVRASNSGDILAVQNSAGTTTHLGVADNGNVRIGTTASSARLHLGAGTSTLPPLKFTAGTNLTTPAAGAVEWDGTKLWITSGSLRKELTLSHVAVVTDFGAKGDGTDDAQALRDAVDALRTTGGLIYLPPNRIYGIGSTVVIDSRLPIYVVSNMGWPYSHEDGSANAQGYLKPLANLSQGFFKWFSPAGTLHGARGGAIGLTFLDNRTYEVHSCLNLTDFVHGVVQDCNFWHIKGRAVYCELATNWHAYRCQTRHCGFTNMPAWQLGDTSGLCFCHIERCFFEQNQDADVVRIPGQVGSGGFNGASFTDCGFEQELSDSAQTQTFINGIGSVAWIRGCTFSRNNATAVIINRPFADVSHNTFTQPPSNTPALKLTTNCYQAKIAVNQCNGTMVDVTNYSKGKAFEILGENHLISGNMLASSGTIYSTGAYNVIRGNKVMGCTAAQADGNVLAQIESFGAGTTIEGNLVDGGGAATLAAYLVGGAETRVIGNMATRLNNAYGFFLGTGSDRSILMGNHATSLNGGTPYYVITPDIVVADNYPRTFNRNNSGVATTLTIAAGVININSSGAYGGSFKIDTEGGAASDNLDTINGATEGDVIWLAAANDARTVVLKHGTGNLQINGNADFSMDSQNDLAIARYNGSKWIVSTINAGT